MALSHSLFNASEIEDLLRGFALLSPVTFLTGERSRVQIGFDQISPSASSTRDLGKRLNS